MAMAATRLGWTRLGTVLGLAFLTLAVGLGSSGRLTYHEAFVAQAAREMLAAGDLVTPTVGGRPWLEKPPLAIWLVALAGRMAGGVGEATARVPSAVAAPLLAAGIAVLAARRFGATVGLLAGLVQATTAWTVNRGRLAEVDILLACLVTWTLVAFDRFRGSRGEVASTVATDADPTPGRMRRLLLSFSSAPDRWRWVFFAGLGLTALAKGVGFGAALALAAVAVVLAWDRDRVAFQRLKFAPGWLLAATLGLTWPLLAVVRHPSVLRLWMLHVSDRLVAQPEYFAGQSGGQYTLGLLIQLLPWLPLALLGAWRSLPQALSRHGRGGGDRLLFAWAIAPLALLALATVHNAHYAIHALPPWSVWAALGLNRLAERRRSRGWTPTRIRATACAGFLTLGLAYALGFAGLGPHLDRRGAEWAFYESAARQLQPGEPVALLYHVPEWDREPYVTPFGSFPHDWAVRLFYLNRPATCAFAADDFKKAPWTSGFAAIGRESDLPALRMLGRVETLAWGPRLRNDRAYVLYRVTPTAVAEREESGIRR